MNARLCKKNCRETHVHQTASLQQREGSRSHWFHLIVEEPETIWEWMAYRERTLTPHNVLAPVKEASHV